MSAKPYTFRESDAARAMRIAKKNGLKVTGFHIMRDGITVMVEGANMPAPTSTNPWDKKDDTDGSGPPRAA